MISLSILVVGILLGLMLYPMLEALENGTFFDWGDEDEQTNKKETSSRR
ncbi:hypothetical protein NOU10_06525 [Ligilactobacillus sp. MP3]|nr:hypothetical protein [Ligilactobacillus sp. MP3]MCQ4117045.1 hypothetical protein [Ligilactobacillus sp. MP3]